MSCKSVKEASEIFQQVIDIHKNAGFKLHKWASSSREVLNKIGCQGEAFTVMPTKTKALGVDWDTQEDTLSFDVEKIKSMDYERHNPIKIRCSVR